MYGLADLLRLTSYQEKIHRALDARSGELISCGTVAEYQIFMKTMFYRITGDAFIAVDALYSPVYCEPSLITAASRFLENNKNQKLGITVATPPAPQDKFVTVLQRFENFEIRRIPAEVASEVKINFILFSNFAYKLDPDKDMTRGVVAFGDKDGFNELLQLYTQIKEFAVPLEEEARAYETHK